MNSALINGINCILSRAIKVTGIERLIALVAGVLTIANFFFATSFDFESASNPIEVKSELLLFNIMMFIILEVLIGVFVVKAMAEVIDIESELAFRIFVYLLYVASAFTTAFNVHYFLTSGLSGMKFLLAFLFWGIVANILFAGIATTESSKRCNLDESKVFSDTFCYHALWFIGVSLILFLDDFFI